MIFNTILHKLFGTPHERKVKKLRPMLADIARFRTEYELLNDDELAAMTSKFRERLAAGSTLEDIQAEAFAVCQEACDRRLGALNVLDPQFGFDIDRLGSSLAAEVLRAREELAAGKPVWEVYMPATFYAKVRKLYPESVRPFRMMPFDVQLIGGMVLHEGCIAEMSTGEGKTLAAACPVYLNGVGGLGVHVVTVNDYLAQRDAANMGRAYRFLGLTVGIIIHGLTPAQRRASYASDVTYGTNNEFGFDYLRDNMASEQEEMVQRELNYCIVDEVDSILIDEARTPLIISGPAEDSTDKYQKADAMVRHLKKDKDYTVDEKLHNVLLTDAGVQACEKLLGVDNLYGDMNAGWVHHIIQALKAHSLYIIDDEYIVREGQIIIIDEHTGRPMEGRRFSDGLHQALEAKEGLQVRRENQTLATISFQNFFRMYKKLGGMTGTADTEAVEFHKIYNLSVTAIPTHKPCIRKDNQDIIFLTEAEKWEAIIEDIRERHEKGQPILVGTVSIDKSEKLAAMLKRHGIAHDVLNAKQHAREAEIIQLAGHNGRVTIATNMAGRGTDIVLGPGVAELGGLHVLGTERHESRRIDNQLRGRAGRQGDPGSSQFFLSLDDDLMRIFGGDRIRNLMKRMGAKEGEVIEHPMVSRSIASAQKRVEGQNFESRKHLLEYDDVMNAQRKAIYALRKRLLTGEDIREEITRRMDEAADIKVARSVDPSMYAENWDIPTLTVELKRSFGVDYAPTREHYHGLTAEFLLDEVVALCQAKYAHLESVIPAADLRNIERRVLLITLDQHWKEHLYAMDHLRDSIRFHGYAQRDPLVAYKKEAFNLFQATLEGITEITVQRLLNIRIEVGAPPPQVQAPQPTPPQRMVENTAQIKASSGPITANSGGSLMPQSAPMQAPAPQQPVPRSALPGAAMMRPPMRPAPQPVKPQGPKLGRNDICWCGSGKKYKKCHGENEA